MRKTTLVVLSDPHAGADALGRVFNALAAAWDFREKGLPVEVLFQGAGTRWPALLADPGHPAHALYEGVLPVITGASCGCADVFEARASLDACGMPVVTGNPVPGTSGLPSLADRVVAGNPVLVF